MLKSHKAVAVGAACILASAALYGAGVAGAGQSTANSTREPYNIGLLVKDIDTYYGTTTDAAGVYQASRTARTRRTWRRSTPPPRATSTRRPAKTTVAARSRLSSSTSTTRSFSARLREALQLHLQRDHWNDYVDRADRPPVFGTPSLSVMPPPRASRCSTTPVSAKPSARRGGEPEEGRRRRQPRHRPHVPQGQGQPTRLPEDCPRRPPGPARPCSTSPAPRAHQHDLGTLIANFGDQYSDLDGGNADRRTSCPTRRTSSPDVLVRRVTLPDRPFVSRPRSCDVPAADVVMLTNASAVPGPAADGSPATR